MLNDFVNKYKGKSVGMPWGFKGECVSLLQYYIHEVAGIPLARRGDALMWAYMLTVQNNFGKVVTNRQPGDIIVWGKELGGGYGHVAIYLGDNKMFHQNDGRTRVATIANVYNTRPVTYVRLNESLIRKPLVKPQAKPTVNKYQRPTGTYKENGRFTNTSGSNIHMRQYVPNVNGVFNGKLAPNGYVDYQDVYSGNGYRWVGNGTTWIPTARIDGNNKVVGKAWGTYTAQTNQPAKNTPTGNWKNEKATFILGHNIYERNQPNVKNNAGRKLIPKGAKYPYDAFSIQNGYVWIRNANTGKVLPWRVHNGAKWGKIV